MRRTGEEFGGRWHLFLRKAECQPHISFLLPGASPRPAAALGLETGQEHPSHPPTPASDTPTWGSRSHLPRVTFPGPNLLPEVLGTGPGGGLCAVPLRLLPPPLATPGFSDPWVSGPGSCARRMPVRVYWTNRWGAVRKKKNSHVDTGPPGWLSGEVCLPLPETRV